MHKFRFPFYLLALLLLTLRPGTAQETKGRWALGFHGGANMWFNDYNKRAVGPGGEMVLRYGITRAFSAGLLAGYEELKSKNTPPVPLGQFDYLKLHAIPAAFVGWIHFAPGKAVNPYFYAGFGAMIYKRLTGGSVYVPDSRFQTSILVPVGVGLEIFAGKKTAIVLDGGYRATDDYPDAVKKGKIGGYATAKAGLNFYLGRSEYDDDDNDGLTNGEEATIGTNPDNPDTDGDGLKDGEEVKQYKTSPLKADSDGDGLSDGDEVNRYRTDPAKGDTDGDGLMDGEEVNQYKTDPLKTDTDGDGLTDGDEVKKYKSDPTKVDTDGDGLSDYDEVTTYRTDPSKADTDGDGLSDSDEVRKYKTDPTKSDTDGGGMADGEEIKRGLNPLDPKDDVLQKTNTIILERGKTTILRGVNFEFNKATLTKDSEKILEQAYDALVAQPDIKVLIVGHTDAVGSNAYNQKLSLRRAQSVKNWMVKKGVSARRMTVAGKGETEPIDDNNTEDGRANNRRIEFRVLK